MLSRHRFALAAVAVVLTFSAGADPAGESSKAAFKKEGASTVEERHDAQGVRIARTTRTRFDFASASAWALSKHYLLSQRFISEERSDREGTDAHLEVTAFRSGAAPYDTSVWVLKTAADEASLTSWGDFYETVRRGCCGAEDLHRLFDIETGSEVAVFSERPAFLAADDRSLDRVVSFLSMMASREGVSFPDGRDVVGVLSLAGRKGVVARLALARTAVEDMGTPKVLVKGAGEKEASDFFRMPGSRKGRPAGEVVDGFRVVLDYGSGLVVTVPIAHGDFDAKNAALPKGFELRRLKPSA